MKRLPLPPLRYAAGRALGGVADALGELRSNLRAALFLLAGRPPDDAPLRPGARGLLVLLAAYAGLDLSYDLLTVGWDDGHFEPFAVPHALFWALCALAASALLALVLRPPAAGAHEAPSSGAAIASRLATAAFGLSCVASVMASALALLADHYGVGDPLYAVFSWLPLIWVSLSWSLAARRWFAPQGRLRGAAVGALALLLALAPQWLIDPSQRMWTSLDAADREAQSSAGNPQSEAVLYSQFDRLQDALEALEPSTSGIPELYSITFGGDGGQDVFLNEAQGADAVLGEIFGGEGHGVVLANSRARPDEAPFATSSSLARSLAAVADRMNPDTDVLALVLSSHGSLDHRLAVSLPPYRFEDITPERLRSLLDESGIRYRVIIVSACYSGGFIEPLASPDTLIITASAADRTSFGCRDGARWTDFGRAFFADALRRTGSFESAFRMAERDIAAREKRDHLDPSQPQIYVGEAVREALARLHTHRGEALLAQGLPPTQRRPGAFAVQTVSWSPGS